MILYLKMNLLLLLHTCDCCQVHRGSYPGTAIECVVKDGARVVFHERPALLGLQVVDVIPPGVVHVTHAEALSFEGRFSLFDEDVLHLPFRAQQCTCALAIVGRG